MQFVKSFDSENIGYQVLYQPADPRNNLIIIPGLGGDLNFFTKLVNQLKILAPKVTVYYLSPRGYAYSTKNFPEGDFNLPEVHAQDLLALINHLRLKKFMLLGHSFGGVTLQTYLNLPLVSQPQKFFLLCSTPKMHGIPILRRIAYQLLAKWPTSKKPFAYQSPAFYQRFGHSWDLDARRWWHDTRVVGGLVAWCLQFLAGTSWQNSNLSTLDQEIGYYLYGKKDIIIPKIVQKWHLKKLNKINKIELNTGHIAPITNAKAFTHVIAKNI